MRVGRELDRVGQVWRRARQTGQTVDGGARDSLTPPVQPTLLIIRHGESEWNVEHRWQGWIDVAADRPRRGAGRGPGPGARGRRGSRRARRLRSDLGRARRTAEIIAADARVPASRPTRAFASGTAASGRAAPATRSTRAGPGCATAWRRGELPAPPGGEDDADGVRPLRRRARRPRSTPRTTPMRCVVTHHGVLRLVATRAGADDAHARSRTSAAYWFDARRRAARPRAHRRTPLRRRPSRDRPNDARSNSRDHVARASTIARHVATPALRDHAHRASRASRVRVPTWDDRACTIPIASRPPYACRASCTTGCASSRTSVRCRVNFMVVKALEDYLDRLIPVDELQLVRPSRDGSPRPMSTKRGTSTSNFGVGKRESHDATAFYERFEAPTLSDDDAVVAPYDDRRPVRPRRRAPHGRDRRRLGRARRHVTAVLRGQAVRGGARARRRPELVRRVPRSCSPTCSPSARASSSRAGASR